MTARRGQGHGHRRPGDDDRDARGRAAGDVRQAGRATRSPPTSPPAGISVVTGRLRARRAEHGRLAIQPGARRLEVGPRRGAAARSGPRVAGLPADDAGFIPTDAHGARRGRRGVWAAGDGTTFPIKQGGLAAQQADAAAERRRARRRRHRPQPFRPVLRGVLHDRRRGRSSCAATSPAAAARARPRTFAVVAAGQDRRPLPRALSRGPGSRPRGGGAGPSHERQCRRRGRRRRRSS